MIELLKGFPDNVAAFALHGHVTKDDYDRVLIPDFENRLVTKSCASTLTSPLIWRASIREQSGRIRSSAGNTSSTGSAAQWSLTSPGRNTLRNSVSSLAFYGPGNTGRSQKLKPARHAIGLLKTKNKCPQTGGGSPAAPMRRDRRAAGELSINQLSAPVPEGS